MSFSSKEYTHAYYLKNRDKMIEYAKKYQWEHREVINRKRKNRNYGYNRISGMEKRHINKVKILSFYANPQGVPICNDCGEQDIDVLCLDHINGGGNKHVRGLHNTLYNWILQNNFPQGFQVLCANCNLKKARLEYFTSQAKP